MGTGRAKRAAHREPAIRRLKTIAHVGRWYYFFVICNIAS
jgi:hypothetical protein